MLRHLLTSLAFLWYSPVEAQPQITANGLFIAGQEKSLACYITTDETVSNFPLTWSRGGSNLAASDEKTVIVSGNVRNYNSFYTLTVQPSDNGDTITCTATLPSGTTTGTWTVDVIKGPDDPVVTGPSTVVSGVPSTWICVVDGASGAASNVYWRFGNGSRLDSGTFNNENKVYQNTNNLEIHNITSTLSLILSNGAPNFQLICYAVHYDTSITKTTGRSITVTLGAETEKTTSAQKAKANDEVGAETEKTTSAQKAKANDEVYSGIVKTNRTLKRNQTWKVAEVFTVSCTAVTGPVDNDTEVKWTWEFQKAGGSDWTPYDGRPSDVTTEDMVPQLPPGRYFTQTSTLNRTLTLADSGRRYRCRFNSTKFPEAHSHSAEEFSVGTVSANVSNVGAETKKAKNAQKAKRADDSSVTITLVSLGLVVAFVIGAVLATWYNRRKVKAGAQGQSANNAAAGDVGNLDAAANTKASSPLFDDSSSDVSDMTDDGSVEGSDADSELP